MQIIYSLGQEKFICYISSSPTENLNQKFSIAVTWFLSPSWFYLFSFFLISMIESVFSISRPHCDLSALLQPTPNHILERAFSKFLHESGILYFVYFPKIQSVGVQSRLTSNSTLSYLSLLHAAITDRFQYTQLCWEDFFLYTGVLVLLYSSQYMVLQNVGTYLINA